MNKYLITDIKHPIFPKLRRIQSIRDFGDVKAGDYGGYIESINNLESKGNCWIYDDGIALSRSRILGNAQIRGSSRLVDEAYVYGDASVLSSVLKGHSRVFDCAHVEESVLLQNVWVHQHARCFKCILTDDVAVYGDATLRNLKLKGWKWIHKSIT